MFCRNWRKISRVASICEEQDICYCAEGAEERTHPRRAKCVMSIKLKIYIQLTAKQDPKKHQSKQDVNSLFFKQTLKHSNLHHSQC